MSSDCVNPGVLCWLGHLHCVSAVNPPHLICYLDNHHAGYTQQDCAEVSACGGYSFNRHTLTYCSSLFLLQTTVGTLLNFGTHGVSRDHAAAAHYLQRAAAAGSDEAMAHLGHMYGAGLGVPQDYEQALKYFKRSAAKQNPLGLYGLGYMYLAGKGVEQSHQTALKFFQQAAEHGDRDAHFYLGAMYMHVSGGGGGLLEARVNILLEFGW
eukprot:GHUV01045783.1.p1 GENE.GHUV01045783.1~~GHUV01045783.1.p1  ORF type:complete len:210 (+),score=49.69 GHUV01045783.1:867-1496(+)